MKKNDHFWDQFQHIFALAPMEDVTDTVFRELIINESKPQTLNLVFSEFLSTDGFCHPVGREKVLHRLHVNDSELALKNKKNIQLIAQIWGTDPDKFYHTAKYIEENTPFDGIDINMGCPQKNIIKKGACSALINHPELAKEIIAATHEATHLPISVKTRIGFKEPATESWIPHLLQTPIKALTVHGRTQKQMSQGLANWDEIKKVVSLRNQINTDIKIIGNGDVLSVKAGKEKMDKYGVDGIMVGRGIFNDFWMFSGRDSIHIEDQLKAMWNHASLFDKTWENRKPWIILRRFFKIYTHHLPMAAQLRDAVMRTQNINELQNALDEYKKKLSHTKYQLQNSTYKADHPHD